jgi:WXG100 family type VII secretion target
MANHSKASSDELEAMAKTVDKFHGETDSELAMIRNEAQKLRTDTWRSPSGASFDDTMRDWDKDVKIMQDAMRDMSTELRKNAGTYEELKRDTHNAFGPNAAAGSAAAAGRSYDITSPPQ